MQRGSRNLLLTQEGVGDLVVEFRQGCHQLRQGTLSRWQVFRCQRQRLHAALGIGHEQPLADHVDLTDEIVFRAERQHHGPSVRA